MFMSPEMSYVKGPTRLSMYVEAEVKTFSCETIPQIDNQEHIYLRHFARSKVACLFRFCHVRTQFH